MWKWKRKHREPVSIEVEFWMPGVDIPGRTVKQIPGVQGYWLFIDDDWSPEWKKIEPGDAIVTETWECFDDDDFTTRRRVDIEIKKKVLFENDYERVWEESP